MTKSQNPSMFFQSINELNLNLEKYRIDLIGNIHPDIKSYIQNNKYDNFIKIKPYMPHKDAIRNMCESDFLDKLQAICVKCGNPASYTQRLSKDDKQVVIGETDIYEARCRHCYQHPEKK